MVTFRDVSTGKKSTERCDILLSAVGGFQQPREARFPGIEKFKGEVFHTAEWNHSFDYADKRIAVIGNGCSAAQVVPSIAPHVKKLTQYARSPQWYHPRPNKVFSAWDKFCFRYIPLLQRWHRLDLFLKTDQLAAVYGPDEKQVREREAIEEEARQYIYSKAPKKYHNFIVPDFPLGCKRRIYDPGYLETLNRENVELLPEGIREVTETGIISEKGKQEEFDAIILATGFKVTSFLSPMKIVGKTGKSLDEQWDMHRGAQAYMGTFVHNYPNFAMLLVAPLMNMSIPFLTSDVLPFRFGPNTFPAFNSVIFAIEVQVDYISNVLIKPILDNYASVIEVDAQAEEKFVRHLDEELSGTVFSAGCSNWYINKAGRNSAAWPGLAASFWKATMFPRWKDFVMEGGSVWWPLRKVMRNLSRRPSLIVLAALAAVAGKDLISSGSVSKSAYAFFSHLEFPAISVESVKMLLG